MSAQCTQLILWLLTLEIIPKAKGQRPDRCVEEVGAYCEPEVAGSWRNGTAAAERDCFLLL